MTGVPVRMLAESGYRREGRMQRTRSSTEDGRVAWGKCRRGAVLCSASGLSSDTCPGFWRIRRAIAARAPQACTAPAAAGRAGVRVRCGAVHAEVVLQYTPA